MAPLARQDQGAKSRRARPERVRKGRVYGCIGAKPSANAAALKKAYRATAKLCHPDKNGDSRAPSAFDAARDAYDILSDPTRGASTIGRRQAAARGEEEPEEEGTFGVVGACSPRGGTGSGFCELVPWTLWRRRRVAETARRFTYVLCRRRRWRHPTP